jgi:hypothetical protein
MQDHEALAWQAGVWNRISDVYVREIDRHFAPVIEALIARAGLIDGDRALDLGTGTSRTSRSSSSRGGGHKVITVPPGSRSCPPSFLVTRRPL